MADPEVVIVGAGAAGVGAGLELAARGVPFVILEAAERVGGRAFTDAASLPVAWDTGCHWFHSADRNPLVDWAERLGVAFAREERIDHFAVWAGGWVGREEREAARAALMAGFDAVYEAGARGDEVPVAGVLDGGAPWGAHVHYILTLMCGEDPERVSARGYADYEDTGVNWPVLGGYGTLVGRMAAGLPVRTGVAVTAVAERPGGVRVETSAGTLEAGAAIVTVSTNVLLSGAIGFGPGPARDLLDLVAEVPCGTYEKVAVLLERPLPVEPNTRFCMVDTGDGRPLDFQVAEGGRLMIAHLGGSFARAMLAAGREEMAEFAVGRLVSAFGSDVRGLVRGVATTGWQDDPLVLGGYSHAEPGAGGRRREMIAADTGRIVLAGEAFSLTAQATAHGAWRSGRDAAARVAAECSARPVGEAG